MNEFTDLINKTKEEIEDKNTKIDSFPYWSFNGTGTTIKGCRKLNGSIFCGDSNILCPKCRCMTKTIKNICGKCKAVKSLSNKQKRSKT